jgi:hypothetical protein
MNRQCEERVSRLLDKIAGIEAGPAAVVKLESIGRFDFRMVQLENRLQDAREEVDHELRDVRGLLQRLETRVEASRAQADDPKPARQLHSAIEELCQGELKVRKDSEIRHAKAID